MKTLKTITSLFCFMILGFALNLNLMGQINPIKQFTGINYPGIHLQADNPLNNFPVISNDQPFYKSTQNSYPCETNHYYWDVTTIWMPDYNMFCSYDSHGNLLTHLRIDASTGDTIKKITNTYDVAQRITKTISQVWNNGNWENYEQYYYEYDEHDNMTIFLYYSWQGSWVPSMGAKNIYTYDNNNMVEHISQTWDQMLVAWVNSTKYIYTYDVNGYRTEQVYQYWDTNMGIWYSSFKETYVLGASGIVNEMIDQNWDNVGSTWVNAYKYTNIVWHNWTGDVNESDLQSMTALNWNNGIWENYTKIDCIWDANGGCIQTTQQYFNGTWINSTRNTNSYDDHGNFILYLYEFWTNNTWTIDMGTQYLLTYNGNDLQERIYQEYDHIMQQWINSQKEEYSQFIYIQGINENPLAIYNIQIYPNPTSGIVNLQSEIPGGQNLTIEIMNTGGQLVYNNQVRSSGEDMYQINLSGCAKGVYFVKLKLDSETTVGKLILQ